MADKDSRIIRIVATLRVLTGKEWEPEPTNEGSMTWRFKMVNTNKTVIFSKRNITVSIGSHSSLWDLIVEELANRRIPTKKGHGLGIEGTLKKIHEIEVWMDFLQDDDREMFNMRENIEWIKTQLLHPPEEQITDADTASAADIVQLINRISTETGMSHDRVLSSIRAIMSAQEPTNVATESSDRHIAGPDNHPTDF